MTEQLSTYIIHNTQCKYQGTLKVSAQYMVCFSHTQDHGSRDQGVEMEVTPLLLRVIHQ